MTAKYRPTKSALRVRLDDVLAYKQESHADRLDALKNLVAEAQELDMGY